ncbi:hypothetical protein E2C01_033052 [Portunus trituberculatus]|uniref:Uncharacterized protein n=1 Tax=Portunus trituberculatus TaxID=210409 RepID=A0A5B7F4L8_PORTR|nr:hypothetical protein [Portunus trituberculatus]
MGERCSTPGEAGVFKRGTNLSFVQQLLSLAVQKAGHPFGGKPFLASCLTCACASKALPTPAARNLSTRLACHTRSKVWAISGARRAVGLPLSGL